MEKRRDKIKEEKAALRRAKAAVRKKSSDQARDLLEKRGIPKTCEYCGINETDFLKVWGKFYGGNRGTKLEPDHKDNDYKNNEIENLCWACCLCNCAKSDKLTHQEMRAVGAMIEKIWRKRSNIAPVKYG